LVGLLVLIAGCAALLSGGGEQEAADSPAEQGEQEEPEKAKSKGSEQQTAAIGETATVGDLAWTVTNARQANQLTSQFLEPKQGNFIVVDFNFLNNGSEAVTLTQNSISLLDDQGRTSEPDTDTFGYIDPNKNILLEQVNPGVTSQGEVIFSVAPDAGGFKMEVGDGNPFSNENAQIDLGF
jgi:hypothetical protein